MSTASAKPVIFISYSHKDEPEHPRDGEIQWLSFVRTYLQPAVKHDVVRLWVDRHMPGGTDWDEEIEQNLRACDIFILLVSANSMASDYIVDKEIKIIRERQANGEDVHFYPILLTPTPDAGLDKVKDKNLRPRDAKPLSSFPYNDRLQQMTEIANEIGNLAKTIVERRGAARPTVSRARLAYVHITGLPETAYERLVGREAELERLDEAWADAKTNIISLIAEGGAGKSALVNEWLRQLQADNYRDAQAVLGWSFYSQGTKERATAADAFLNWALDKLAITLETTSASAKGEAIAEEITRRRVLLVLDGVEPLQHGPGPQLGELKDFGLRALLRRLAATPPGEAHGLVVLTSRLAVKDIGRWRDRAAPVENVERLSNEAGAALLRDNGVWGTDKELKAAAHDFGGHPLALGLLASFLKETQTGEVRRRDHIRAYFEDPDNPRHDHAKRVMESYEKGWLAGQPVLLAIMQMVGLFDRPASGDCLEALRGKPAIKGLANRIVRLNDDEWQRAATRLREARLLAPPDPAAPDALDAHPLVREWFGERLKQTSESAWKAAHGRLYEHLRDTTKEGETPTLEDLAPLYQAIAHGCRAGRHQEALDSVCWNRIYRKEESYTSRQLGALGSNLEALSWFFEKCYETPVTRLRSADRSWVLAEAAFCLRAQGRLVEALPTLRAALQMAEKAKAWANAATRALNLSEAELIIGEVDAAIATAELSIGYADRSGDQRYMMITRSTHAEALHAAGRRVDAARLFANAEEQQKRLQPAHPLLYSVRGYQYCNLLLGKSEHTAARERATRILGSESESDARLDRALVRLTLGRSHLGLALAIPRATARRGDTRAARTRLDQAVDGLRSAAITYHIPRGLLARTAFRRGVGDWEGAARDLDEVEEIADPGPMKLFLCDMALERARLAFAKIEAFAPLNGMLEKDNPPRPTVPSPEGIAQLKAEAGKQLKTAAEYIEKCGYHRRDEELAELQAVLKGEKTFAELPPRV
jgi:tetratricopeptide (TPR) repeat protein